MTPNHKLASDKKSCLKHFATGIAIFLLYAPHISIAQDLKGIWAGNLISDTTGVKVINTEYVLNIREQKENIVSGTAYVLERRFVVEGVLDFIGILDQNKLKVSELKILSSKIGIEGRLLCIKLLDLNLKLTDSADYLQGHWTGAMESGDRCVPGMAYLKRAKPGMPLSVSPRLLSRIATDTGPIGFADTRLAPPTIINVRNRIVSLQINDYLREDGDTISIYTNRKMYIRKLPIMRKPTGRLLRIDTSTGMTEVIIYAENLGRVPPNTCEMLIDDGFKKQRVIIESSKETSAVIYLRYQPPG